MIRYVLNMFMFVLVISSAMELSLHGKSVSDQNRESKRLLIQPHRYDLVDQKCNTNMDLWFSGLIS